MPLRIATHTPAAGTDALTVRASNALTVRAFDLAVCLLVLPAVLVPTIPGFLTEGLMTAEGAPKPAFYAYQHAR